MQSYARIKLHLQRGKRNGERWVKEQRVSWRGESIYYRVYIYGYIFPYLSPLYLCPHHARKAAAVAPFKKRNRFYENTLRSAVKLTTLSKILQNAKILLGLCHVAVTLLASGEDIFLANMLWVFPFPIFRQHKEREKERLQHLILCLLLPYFHRYLNENYMHFGSTYSPASAEPRFMVIVCVEQSFVDELENICT